MSSAKEVRNLLCDALLTDPDEIELVRFLRPPSRNPVWRCQVRGYKFPLFLKLQSGKPRSSTLDEEIGVLRLFTDSMPLIPRVIASSTSYAAPYLLTAALPGEPSRYTVGRRSRSFFKDIVRWISLLQSQVQLRPMLNNRALRYVGRYAPAFDPIMSATAELSSASTRLGIQTTHEIERRLHAAGRNFKRQSPDEIIHGSIAPENLLVHRGHLSGVMDFEATRIGNLMFDVAHYGLDLLENCGIDVASEWFAVCGNAFARERIRYHTPAFLIEAFLTRMNTTRRRTGIRSASESLLLLCDMLTQERQPQ